MCVVPACVHPPRPSACVRVCVRVCVCACVRVHRGAPHQGEVGRVVAEQPGEHGLPADPLLLLEHVAVHEAVQHGGVGVHVDVELQVHPLTEHHAAAAAAATGGGDGEEETERRRRRGGDGEERVREKERDVRRGNVDGYRETPKGRKKHENAERKIIGDVEE